MTQRTEVVFDIPLNSRGDRIQVAIIREGKVVVHFVAELWVVIGGVEYAVVRHDCADGGPHRDTLDWNGDTLFKHWSPRELAKDQALTNAITDLKDSWERYLDSFMRRRP